MARAGDIQRSTVPEQVIMRIASNKQGENPKVQTGTEQQHRQRSYWTFEVGWHLSAPALQGRDSDPACKEVTGRKKIGTCGLSVAQAEYSRAYTSSS
jgi:hypothetical protein